MNLIKIKYVILIICCSTFYGSILSMKSPAHPKVFVGEWENKTDHNIEFCEGNIYEFGSLAPKEKKIFNVELLGDAISPLEWNYLITAYKENETGCEKLRNFTAYHSTENMIKSALYLYKFLPNNEIFKFSAQKMELPAGEISSHIIIIHGIIDGEHFEKCAIRMEKLRMK